MTQATLARIRLSRLRIPLKAPYRLAFGPVEHFDTLLVECTSGEGAIGLGEATLLTGYTDETIDDAWQTALTLSLEMEGSQAREALTRVEALVAARPFTATAFGTALEMLAGSAYLKLEREQAVPLLAILNAEEGRALAEEFEQRFAEGYRTFKVKVGFELEKDLRKVRAVQSLTRGRAAIRIDANQGYSARDGVRFVRALDPADIELFEQPCAASDWESHLQVARAAAVPMMLDESIYGLHDIERAADLHAAAYVKLKLMKVGTMEALGRAIERIRALGMKPVLGNGIACDLGCWMEACVAARHIDNAGEMNGFLKAKAGLLKGMLDVRSGALVLKPGFHAEAAREALQPFVLTTT